VGEAPDERTVANAKKNGIDISALRARQFSSSDFDVFDTIYVMDKSNLRDVLRLAKKDTHKSKVQLFLENDGEVPDPYYGSSADFEQVFQLVYRNCERLTGLKS
jgi:protein-tyrosine phosphatase